MLGHFAKAEVEPKRWMAEFKVRGEEGLGVSVGDVLGAGWFKEGMWVDVRGISRGMGFAGVSLWQFSRDGRQGWIGSGD